MEIRQQLNEQLKRLKMPGVLHSLDLRLAEARETDLGYLEFLSLLIADELENREQNMLTKRIKAAGFGVHRTFEDFDFRINGFQEPGKFLLCKRFVFNDEYFHIFQFNPKVEFLPEILLHPEILQFFYWSGNHIQTNMIDVRK